jgi:hypothetical protein
MIYIYPYFIWTLRRSMHVCMHHMHIMMYYIPSHAYVYMYVAYICICMYMCACMHAPALARARCCPYACPRQFYSLGLSPESIWYVYVYHFFLHFCLTSFFTFVWLLFDSYVIAVFTLAWLLSWLLSYTLFDKSNKSLKSSLFDSCLTSFLTLV